MISKIAAANIDIKNKSFETIPLDKFEMYLGKIIGQFMKIDGVTPTAPDGGPVWDPDWSAEGLKLIKSRRSPPPPPPLPPAMKLSPPSIDPEIWYTPNRAAAKETLKLKASDIAKRYTSDPDPHVALNQQWEKNLSRHYNVHEWIEYFKKAGPALSESIESVIDTMILSEFKKYKGKGTNPCWAGYRPGAKTGTKTKKGKSGKTVANCEKINEEDIDEQTITDYQRDPYKYGMTAADVLKGFPEDRLYGMQQMRERRKKKGDPAKGTGKKPKGSGRRLYTDEDPSDTVSVEFKTAAAIRRTLAKKSFKSKSHKRQSQIINLIHQRARAAYRNAKDPATKRRLKRAYEYAKERKEASKRKTQRMKK